MSDLKLLNKVIALLDENEEWACESFGNEYRNMVTLDEELKDSIRNLANESNKQPDTKALRLQNVSGSCLIGYLEWKDSLYKENRGVKVMYDVCGEHKWLDDDELFECWKKRNNYR